MRTLISGRLLTDAWPRWRGGWSHLTCMKEGFIRSPPLPPSPPLPLPFPFSSLPFSLLSSLFLLFFTFLCWVVNDLLSFFFSVFGIRQSPLPLWSFSSGFPLLLFCLLYPLLRTNPFLFLFFCYSLSYNPLFFLPISLCSLPSVFPTSSFFSTPISLTSLYLPHFFD